MARRALALLALLGLLAAPLAARESLGVFETWGAYVDRATPRCHAIAMPQPDRRAQRPTQPYASVGTWPRKKVRGQVHFRLSRPAAARATAALSIGRRSFVLLASGADAWARSPAEDAAIVAAMRSAPAMTLRGRDAAGRRYADKYPLAGAASAMDAATLACARLR